MTIDTSCNEVLRDARYVLAESYPAELSVESHDHRAKDQLVAVELIDLSERGMKLASPQEIEVHHSVRLKLSIVEFGMEFYISASVCWCRGEGDQWLVGCHLSPSLPERLFKKFVHGGNLDRRCDLRFDKSADLEASWNLNGDKATITLRNISRGGFCVLSDRPCQTDQRIHICLAARQDIIVVARAEWQMTMENGWLVGCSFCNSRDFDRLKDFLQSA